MIDWHNELVGKIVHVAYEFRERFIISDVDFVFVTWALCKSKKDQSCLLSKLSYLTYFSGNLIVTIKIQQSGQKIKIGNVVTNLPNNKCQFFPF